MVVRFAYVVFEKEESVASAVEQMNGAQFLNRHLKVDVCKQVGWLIPS